MKDAGELLAKYEQCVNTHDFDQVAPLIAEDALFWFNDGSYSGLPAIRAAFESTWAWIEQERYQMREQRWVALDDNAAVCTYHFHWEGLVNGEKRQGGGRGTTVLRRSNGTWLVAHEHLSGFPTG